MRNFFINGCIKQSKKSSEGNKVNIGSSAFIEVKNNQIIHKIANIENKTTCNRMEIQAAISVLKFAKRFNNSKFIDKTIHIHSDSNYLISGMNEWLVNWKKRNFEGIKNSELWKELNYLCRNLNITWILVKDPNNSHNQFINKFCLSAIHKHKNLKNTKNKLIEEHKDTLVSELITELSKYSNLSFEKLNKTINLNNESLYRLNSSLLKHKLKNGQS